jgi:predicted DNA-binding transcriptional regulator YafY
VYQPTTRVLALLELLQARGQLSGAELAARLEISRRTVRRYVATLQDLGIPVEGARGRHGAYRLRPGFKLPPLMFTDDEALSVVLGLLAVRRLGLAVAAPDVEAAAATLALDLAPTAAPAEGAIVVALRQAAQQRRRVRLGYRAWDGRVTERAVDPYGLVYRGQRWFMVGRCLSWPKSPSG